MLVTIIAFLGVILHYLSSLIFKALESVKLHFWKKLTKPNKKLVLGVIFDAHYYYRNFRGHISLFIELKPWKVSNYIFEKKLELIKSYSLEVIFVADYDNGIYRGDITLYTEYIYNIY